MTFEITMDWDRDYFNYDKRLFSVLTNFVQTKNISLLDDLDTFAWVPKEFEETFDDDFVNWEKNNTEILTWAIKEFSIKRKEFKNKAKDVCTLKQDDGHDIMFAHVNWNPNYNNLVIGKTYISFRFWLIECIYKRQNLNDLCLLFHREITNHFNSYAVLDVVEMRKI